MEKRFKCVLFCCIAFLPLFITSCSDDENAPAYNTRQVVTRATLLGEYGYIWGFPDGGDLLSIRYKTYDLEGSQRGVYEFYYPEDSQERTIGDIEFSENVRVIPREIYEVIRPVTLAEAEARGITNPDSLSVPEDIDITFARGYLDLDLPLKAQGAVTGQGERHASVDLMYDPSTLASDAIRLRLLYRSHVPADWEYVNYRSGTICFDLSALTELPALTVSPVHITIDVGNGELFEFTLSKEQMQKPEEPLFNDGSNPPCIFG